MIEFLQMAAGRGDWQNLPPVRPGSTPLGGMMRPGLQYTGGLSYPNAAYVTQDIGAQLKMIGDMDRFNKYGYGPSPRNPVLNAATMPLELLSGALMQAANQSFGGDFAGYLTGNPMPPQGTPG